MMKFINKIILASLTTLFILACSAETSRNEPQLTAASQSIALSQIHKHWVLIAIDGQAIESSINSSLAIDKTAKATGNFACNHFFGRLELQGKRLRIDKMGSTRKMCRDKVNEVEMIVARVLGDWSEIQVSTDKLILIGREHQLSYAIKQ